jgi:LPXTG-motif cell wall-anchored protein
VVSNDPSADPLDADRPAPAPVPVAHAYWRGWSEVRADLRSSAGIVLVLAAAGLLAGLLWWWLAPRADFRITDTGPIAVGNPSEELFIADDSVLALILVALGLLAGGAAWFLRRRRGVATVLALAVGASLMAVVAWQLGEALGAGPTEAQLADIGSVVTTRLALGSPPALALAPFAALLAYLVPVITVHRDDLGRPPEPTVDPAAEPTPEVDSERPLEYVPPGPPAP